MRNNVSNTTCFTSSNDQKNSYCLKLLHPRAARTYLNMVRTGPFGMDPILGPFQWAPLPTTLSPYAFWYNAHYGTQQLGFEKGVFYSLASCLATTFTVCIYFKKKLSIFTFNRLIVSHFFCKEGKLQHLMRWYEKARGI